MRKDQQAMTFQVDKIIVTNQFAHNITKQIQYYFSMVNLATDHYLRELISDDRRGWVKIEKVLSFYKIQQYFEFQYGSRLSEKNKIRIIEQSLKRSTKLRSQLGGIRIDRKLVWKNQFQRVLYLEGDSIHQQQIISTLSAIYIEESHLIFRRGPGWYFIQFQNQSKDKIEEAKNQLSNNLPVRLLTMDQFFAYESRIQNILQKIQIEVEKQPDQIDRKIQPRKIYEFNGFEGAKKKLKSKQKTKKIKKIKQVEKPKIVTKIQKVEKIQKKYKNQKYSRRRKIIYSDYIPPRLHLRTRNKHAKQEYQKRRASKIQIWKQKKQEKLSLQFCKMEIENQSIDIEK